MAGESSAQRKKTVQVIDEIEAQVRRYLMVLLVANLLVGLGTWLSFRLLGVKYPELWGIAAAILQSGLPLVFEHPLVRAAVYGELGPGERMQWHGRAAAVQLAAGAADVCLSKYPSTCAPSACAAF